MDKVAINKYETTHAPCPIRFGRVSSVPRGRLKFVLFCVAANALRPRVPHAADFHRRSYVLMSFNINLYHVAADTASHRVTADPGCRIQTYRSLNWSIVKRKYIPEE